MVSPLSARLLAHSGNSSSSSNSSKGNSAKRSFSSQSQLRPDFRGSGYSADREEPSVSPPLSSIDLLGNSRRNNSGEENGNKRRKRNELEFAATSVKADLARAGVDFRKIEKDKEETSCLGDVTINLKGVRLMFSSELDTPIVSSNVSAKTSMLDYEALAFSCWDAYPNLSNRIKASKNFTPSDQESDRSTSSFSDTESDSVESSGNGTNVSKNGNSADKAGSSATTNVLFIPPNIDDHLKAEKQAKRVSIMQGRPCNIIVSPSESVTLSQVLQLSKTARLVTKASAPFSVIHANAAFARLCGISSEKILGTPFSKMEDVDDHGEQICLQDCLVSSSSGNYQKISIQSASAKNQATECLIKVTPIVARISDTSEVMAVEHFCVELFLEDDESSVRSVSPISAQALPVGVMG